MKRVAIFFIIVGLFFCSLDSFAWEQETDGTVSIPAKIAKQYVAKKYNYDFNDLTTGDAQIGKRGAVIDIRHGYKTERVILHRDENGWKAISSASPQDSLETS